jgi:succinoglycan biosynthesis transport protein ExoP
MEKSPLENRRMQEFPNSFEPMPADADAYGSVSQVPWYRSPRFRLFTCVLLLGLAAGLTYTLSQPAIYESRASLLVSAMTAVDQSSTAPDIQHVTIQRQLLLGNKLITDTRDQLDKDVGYDLTRSEIREIMLVEPIPDTNLVEMVARGEHEQLLPLLIDTWTEVYLAARAAEIEQSTSDTTRIVGRELEELNGKIDSARVALDNFRREHNIISAQREEKRRAQPTQGPEPVAERCC